MNARPALFAAACLIVSPALADEARPKSPPDRKGDEIIVCGQFVSIGTPVVTFIDPGGYDAYDLVDHSAPGKALAKGFGDRKMGRLPSDVQKRVAAKGWDLPALQQQIDQFVIHYDVCGTSKRCFDVLHNRGLSVQFMLDLDGTIYQTLDLKENAWHATIANSRSVGIEIANMGAVPPGEVAAHFKDWYKQVGSETVITIPGGVANSGIRNRSIELKPSRPGLVEGKIHGTVYEQYDLTPQQYAALIKLTAGLNKVFPKIKLDYPRGADGKLLLTDLSDEAFGRYEGVLGHFHVQANKQDPGPAFQWDRVIDGARAAASSSR